MPYKEKVHLALLQCVLCLVRILVSHRVDGHWIMEQVPNASLYGCIEGIVDRNSNSLPISSVGLGFLHANNSSPLIVNHY